MKVSVAMITYNHERFIVQAIESVLMQKTAFKFELVIGDDCSTDRTRSAVIDMQRRYPDKISVLLHPTNIGMMPNFMATLRACKGKYIALLEGDDFWTASDKLQAQVDLLDSNPELAIAFHNTTVVDNNGIEQQLFPLRVKKEVFTLEDLLECDCMMPTCSVMYRNRLFTDFPIWYSEMAMGDLPLHVLNARFGNIGFSEKIMAAYRIHSGGVWTEGRPLGDTTFSTKRAVGALRFYEAVQPELGSRYSSFIQKKIAMWSYDLVWAYQCAGDWRNMRKYLAHGFRVGKWTYRPSIKVLAKYFVISHAPWLYQMFRRMRKQA
ncbi:MAG: putative glycosyltransferase [Verrucomicrobiales bacterium]|nr:putative glycosyltransferase [Verrucomicrobiales bacterium]